MSHLIEIPPARRSSAWYLSGADALREVLVLADNAELELPEVCIWKIEGFGHRQPVLSGQLGVLRSGVTPDPEAWVHAFGGAVVTEAFGDDDIKRTAVFEVAGTRVQVWSVEPMPEVSE